MTAQTLILQALRQVGVLRPGQTASAEMLADGLAILNQMVDAWNVERANVHTIVRNVLDVTAGQQTYTLGTGGNWNIARPSRIERASVISNADGDQPLELPIPILDFQDWQAVTVKATESTLPLRIYCDYAFPLANVSLWPVPTDSSVDIALYTWQTLSQFANLNSTDYTFPPGYALALRYNLGVELFPMSVTNNKTDMRQIGQIREQAATLKANIKRLNLPAPQLSVDPTLAPRQTWNWLTGDTV